MRTVPTTPPPAPPSPDEQRWGRLRAGARNVAGVTYQVAVSADLLVAGAKRRAGHPRITTVVPEGWEDIDCTLADGEQLHIQSKERGERAEPLGLADIADAVAHAAPSLSAGSQAVRAAFALVTDAALRPGLEFTGWNKSLADLLSTSAAGQEALSQLRALLEARLQEIDHECAPPSLLLEHVHLVHRPWHLSLETVADLRTHFGLRGVVASLAYAVVVRTLVSKTADQRSASAVLPEYMTIGDLDSAVARLGSSIDVESLEEAIKAGVCEPVDYLHSAVISPERFFKGVDVAPAHVAAGLDVVRAEELERVLTGLADRGHVTIAGPSGSGKSALLWRAGRIAGRGARTLHVRRIADLDDVELLIRHVWREEPDERSPLLICADDLGRDLMSAWPEALRRLREIPSVFVLAAVRREDFNPGMAGNGVVVDARLHESSATAIYERLRALGLPLSLEPEEAAPKAKGLLMEYLALLLTGTRLRDVLAEQVSALRGAERTLERDLLRIVSAAHSLGSAVHADALAGHLRDRVGGDVARIGDALAVLEGEYLLLQDGMGNWRGLHDLRTDHLQQLLHESPPPTLAGTFAEVLPLLPHAGSARALRRGAEQLARLYDADARSPAEPFRRLRELTELLAPVAKAAQKLLSDADATVDNSAIVIGLLEGGERLDAVAYLYAVLPRLIARCPPTLHLAQLAWLASTVRNDGLRLPDFGGGPAINALADALPARSDQLSNTVGSGISGQRLASLAVQLTTDRACVLLESSEQLVPLTAEEARDVWSHHVPGLPSPPGSGLDLPAAEWRARLAAVLVALSNVKGPEVAPVLGPVEARAADAIACDPYGVSVALTLEPHADDDDEWLPAMARRMTFEPGRLLVAAATVFAGASERGLPTTYAPQPGAKPGAEEDARRVCQRLLDACPEVDRADMRPVGANGELPSAGGHSFGSKTIRSGVLRGGVPVRRNVAFQAATARALAGDSWSTRLRMQAQACTELIDVLSELPLRLRASDNARRQREWLARTAAVEHTVVALPSRPLDEDERRDLIVATTASTATARDEDERARSSDRAKDALSLVAGCLTQAANTVASREADVLFGAGTRLREAPGRLAEAREQGAPLFAAVGDTLPPELDAKVHAASTLLLAVGSDPSVQSEVARARTVDDISHAVEQAARRQAERDQSMLQTHLESEGADVVAVLAVPDSAPLLSRLDGGQVVCLVSAASWHLAESALRSWDPDEREGAAGRLLVIAVDDGAVLPIGLQVIGKGEPLPLGFEDIDAVAKHIDRPLRRGRISRLVSVAANDLVAWSTAVALRGARTSSWEIPPLPDRSPEAIRRDLTDLVSGQPPAAGSTSETAVEALGELAEMVALEDGTFPGLAAHLADALAGPGIDALDDLMLFNLAVAAALQADREV